MTADGGKKSSGAFRTIGEAAAELGVPNHVLRFWEDKFPQVKPMKRSGNRRLYRPADLELLQGIRYLLRDKGYTIKGVRRILREQGSAYVKQCWRQDSAQTAAGSKPLRRKPAPAGLSKAQTQSLRRAIKDLEMCQVLLARAWK